MPITKSAKKALRQNIARRARNAKMKNTIRILSKKVKVLANNKKSDEAKKILILVIKAIDKAAKNNVLKRNTASRKKSKLAKLANTISKSA